MPSSILTQDKLNNFLTWLSRDQKTAATEFVYLQVKLTKYFEWKGCFDADECVDETIDNIASKVTNDFVVLDSSGKIVENKVAYIIGTARNVFNQWWKQRKKHPSMSLNSLPDLAGEVNSYQFKYDESDNDTLETCRRNCLNRLRIQNETEWQLLVNYYGNVDGQGPKIHRKRLATESGKTPNAIRIEICRIRQILWRCVSKCIKMKN